MHALSGLSILISQIIGFLLLWDSSKGLINNVHSKFGFFVFIAVFVSALGGLITAWAKRSLNWHTMIIKILRMIHGWFGVVLFLSNFIACVLGI